MQRLVSCEFFFQLGLKANALLAKYATVLPFVPFGIAGKIFAAPKFGNEMSPAPYIPGSSLTKGFTSDP